MNIDHTNPNHKKSKEAKDLLSDLEAANIRRLPLNVPTWQSYGLHKVCSCPSNLQEDKKYNVRSVQVGKKPFQCNVCDEEFETETVLRIHIGFIHEGKKPFKYKVCDKEFKAESVLKNHIGSVHEGKKPFKCSDCKVSFSSELALKNHVQSIHTVRAACGCLKSHLTSVIDNVYLSFLESAHLQVLEDAISDHFPL